MKKIFSFYAILGIMFLVATALNAYTETARIQYSFVMSAGQANMAEVEFANLALAKSQNEQVKQFAQLMIAEHGRMATELRGLATQKKYAFPSDLNDAQKAAAENMSKLTGSSFDRAFAEAMVADHQAAVSLFEAEAKAGTDLDVKAWAAKSLPTLQLHLQKARELNTSIK